MDRRLQPVRVAALGVLALALLASGPWLGFWTLVPLLVAGVLFKLADTRIESAERPEYAIFAAWAGSQVVIAIAVLLSGAPHAPAIAWLAIPIVTLSARFSFRPIVVGVAFTMLLLFAVQLGSDLSAVLDDPTLVIAPAALILAVAILSTALMHSDVEHRTEAVIDGLTGMLNRKALTNRVDELAQQSQLTGDPVALIVVDLDNFKAINDSIGHQAGDAVLRDVAYVIRKELRAFDLAYRLGGEEFAVLLPGSDVEGATRMAEVLRLAVELKTGSSSPVSVSCGVAASQRGEAFNFERVFEHADAALYEAKRAGRNRVMAAETAEPKPPVFEPVPA